MIVLSHKKECCGCTACLSICPQQCIRMEGDEEGFLYPVTDSNRCTDCGLCEKVCPCLHRGTFKEPIQYYAAVHRDEKIRTDSSSGGLFTAIAEATLRNGGVVFGARFDKEFKVVHDYTETVEGLSAFRGSKYVQSDMQYSFRQAEKFLKEGREVLFSGVPCQIAGLRAFLRREYENLLALDLLCHGAASPAVWAGFLQPYITAQEPEQLTEVAFRDKQNGWKSYDFCLHYGEKEIRFDRRTNPYMTGYLANLYLRPSCHACPQKGFGAGSDLTLGDCWGIEKELSHPDYCTDDKGVSLIAVHTSKGADRIRHISSFIRYVPIDYKSMKRYNPAIWHAPVMNPQRKRFFVRWRRKEDFSRTVASLTRPTFVGRLKIRCTPLLKALGIKGFIKRLRK